jgi:hypothetical protein
MKNEGKFSKLIFFSMSVVSVLLSTNKRIKTKKTGELI